MRAKNDAQKRPPEVCATPVCLCCARQARRSAGVKRWYKDLQWQISSLVWSIYWSVGNPSAVHLAATPPAIQIWSALGRPVPATNPATPTHVLGVYTIWLVTIPFTNSGSEGNPRGCSPGAPGRPMQMIFGTIPGMFTLPRTATPPSIQFES